MFTLAFLGFGILVWFFAGKMLLSVRRQRRTAGLMRKTETSRAAGVAGLAYLNSALAAGLPGAVAQTILRS